MPPRLPTEDASKALEPISSAMDGFALGEQLQGRGDYERAVTVYDIALAHLAKDTDLVLGSGASMRARILANKGDALRCVRRYAEAEKAFDEALRLDPRQESAWFNKGLCFFERKRWAEALDCFDRASRSRFEGEDGRRNLVDALEHKARCLEELGRPKDAARARDQAMRIIDPSSASSSVSTMKNIILSLSFIVGAGIGFAVWSWIGLGLGALAGIFVAALVVSMVYGAPAD